PLRYCPNCCGFWAAGDSLSRGVADPNTDHPALRAGLPPRRCRGCNGHLKPNGYCTKCKRSLPTMSCPACHMVMTPLTQHSITIDVCGMCHGRWFDMGEITAVLGIVRTPSLAALNNQYQEVKDELEDGLDPWINLLVLALRLFLFRA
ncbi:MAG: zf-TFIIB domain-containing protein, partial [Tepidiformaceae bacterium]